MRPSDLIYDVGMHTGEDTAYYLAKGFRVVAFEADPELVLAGKQRFGKAIASGRLLIVAGAIVPPDMVQRDGTVRFLRKKGLSEIGTVVPEWMQHNDVFSGAIETLAVPAIDFTEQLARHGAPHYLKIDIEGVDRTCLDGLVNTELLPAFLSIEVNRLNQQESLQNVQLLRSLGYRRFCLVDQRALRGTTLPSPQKEGISIDWTFCEASSGPFGADLAQEWVSEDDIRRQITGVYQQYRWFGDRSPLQRLKLGRYHVGPIIARRIERIIDRPLNTWHDLHARRD